MPPWALDEGFEAPFSSVTRTADELCVVCAWDALPGWVTAVGPFTAFSVDGPLDHSLIGVLAGLFAPLAEAGISILAESTFDTDWILVACGTGRSGGRRLDLGRAPPDRGSGAVSVTGAAGFLAGAAAAGLKASGNADLAIVVNTGPDFAAAGMFTSNRVKAAPVLWSEQVLAGGRVRAVILNSGGGTPAPDPRVRRHPPHRRAGGVRPESDSR